MARGRNSKGDKDEPETGSLEVGMLCKSSFNDNELDSYLRQGEIKASEKPPVPPQILWVGDCTIATFGNFSASTGKAKSKKTFNITAMVAAAVTNTTVLNYRASLPEGKRMILYFDTEQSKFHCHNVIERIYRLAGLSLNKEDKRIRFYGLREFTPSLRIALIDYALRTFEGVGLVIIDGLRDLMYDINNAKESTDVMTMLMAWTDKGWEQAMREGNYDRSREHLNFEIQRGGIVTPIDKSRPLTRRMAENLASRGIKDPNEGLDEPRYRTVVNFIFGGSTERMRELAFGNQEVDFESKKGNEHIRRMPEIEEWAKDIYRFVADKYGEENIISFIVHCDEKNPHVHCALLPIDEEKKFAFKKIFHGQNRVDFKNYMLALHDELAKVNEKWGLTRGVSITETGARHRSTEEYRRWLANECVTLEAQMDNTRRALKDLNVELAIAQKKQKSFTSMIENLKAEKERLEDELRPLRELQANSDSISAGIARKIQHLEQQKALVETKLADKEKKLDETNQLLDTLRKDKAEIEQLASELEEKANRSELSWAHNMSYHLNGVILDTMAQEFTSRFPKLPDDVKLDFDGTLLMQLAEEGNHVVKVALNLVCGFIDDATTIAQTHGGGGGGPSSGWGQRPDEDDREWARRCLAMARKMCKPSVSRKKKM